jgi:hypothetical protein
VLRQSSDAYGNEIFFFLGTSLIPDVTPRMLLVTVVANAPGSYLEFRLDGGDWYLQGSSRAAALRSGRHKPWFITQPTITVGTTFSLVS